MRYPIGIQTFEKIINGNYVYVDKTDLVYMVAQENVCFFSRPRRFGKSLLLSTLDAYFRGRQDLFTGLKIEKDEKEWVKHPVFRIDFAGGDYTKPETLNAVLSNDLEIWEKQYGVKTDIDDLAVRFRNVIGQAKEKTGRNVVVLVDEYDKPMLDALGTDMEEQNRNTLKSFYGTFKAADEDLRFVMLTGVTKFSQISVFSGFNQPYDLSMDSQFDALCGITEKELYEYFAEPIESLADRMKKTTSEVKAELKRRYDGYHFSEEMLDVYNPFSIIHTFKSNRISDYWASSGNPAYLVKLLNGHHINIQKLTGKTYARSYFMDYRADAEDPLAMLYQSGYLTIRDYDVDMEEYSLDFPNEEVRRGFVVLLAAGYFGKSEADMRCLITDIAKMLRKGDVDGVKAAFTSFLASIPYVANKDERALDYESHYQYTFYMINRLLSSYTTLIEKQNSKGRADIIIESENDIYIFEFKLDKSAKEALKQIEDCQYALPYLGDPRKLHKIGVNILSESRTVEEWLVE